MLKNSDLYVLSGQRKKKKVKVTQSSPTLCNLMDYTFQGILQARILEWVAFPFSRGSSQIRDQTQGSHTAGRFFTSRATREAQEYWSGVAYPFSSRSSWPRNRIGDPCITGRFFTTWAIKNWCFKIVVLKKTHESLGLQGSKTSQY